MLAWILDVEHDLQETVLSKTHGGVCTPVSL